jgi:hypothetical protein
MLMLTKTGGERQSRLDGRGREGTPERSALPRCLELFGAHQERLRAILGGRKGRRDGRQDTRVNVLDVGGGVKSGDLSLK